MDLIGDILSGNHTHAMVADKMPAGSLFSFSFGGRRIAVALVTPPEQHRIRLDLSGNSVRLSPVAHINTTHQQQPHLVRFRRHAADLIQGGQMASNLSNRVAYLEI